MKGGSSALLAALLLATVSASAALPAPATLPEVLGPGVAPTLALLAAQPELTPAFGQAMATNAQGTSPTQVLRDLLGTQGFEAAPLPLTSFALARAPPELAVPLGRLAAAAALAEELRASAVADLTPEEQAWVLEHGLWDAAPLAPPDAPMVGDRAVSAYPSAAPWALDPRAADLAARVDTGKLHTAALTILAAIEASAPELRAAAATPGPGVDATCAGGTVRFESNNCEIVVGDTGPNVYLDARPILIIDLGGTDVYSNGAALAEGNVRVVVDNAGNDLYAIAAGSGSGANVLAKGIATAAMGVAVLADLGGNDLYTATAVTTAPEPGPAAGRATISAMGVANIGAAVLVDAGGRDAFTGYAMSHGGPVSTFAQGQATIGLGAVLNLDAADAGADDAYSLVGESLLHIVLQTPQRTEYTNGPAETSAQGSGDLAGVGVLVDAGGNDGYFAEPRGSTATLRAQGSGAGGAGVLVDAQGNDAMTARALGDTTLTLVMNGGCWEVSVTVTTGETRATAHGAASLGAGALVDGTGHDIRLIEARGHAGAIAGVNTTANCSFNRATSTATSGPGTAVGQGSGSTGLGVLVDLQGNDVNDLRASSTALASSVITGPGTKFESATATSGPGQTLGQAHSATGIGLLADAGGADTYASRTTSLATRVTSGGATSVAGPVLQTVQAWGAGGLAWLLDLDGTDAYTTVPAGASLAGNNKCWSQGPDGGRGRDWVLTGVVLPGGCP